MLMLGALFTQAHTVLAQTFFPPEFKNVVKGLGVNLEIPKTSTRLVMTTIVFRANEFEDIVTNMDALFGIGEQAPAGTARIYQQATNAETVVIYLVIPYVNTSGTKKTTRRVRGKRTREKAQQNRLLELEAHLAQSLTEENFEEAARTRDEIQRIRLENQTAAVPKPTVRAKKQEKPEN